MNAVDRLREEAKKAHEYATSVNDEMRDVGFAEGLDRAVEILEEVTVVPIRATCGDCKARLKGKAERSLGMGETIAIKAGTVTGCEHADQWGPGHRLTLENLKVRDV